MDTPGEFHLTYLLYVRGEEVMFRVEIFIEPKKNLSYSFWLGR